MATICLRSHELHDDPSNTTDTDKYSTAADDTSTSVTSNTATRSTDTNHSSVAPHCDGFTQRSITTTKEDDKTLLVCHTIGKPQPLHQRRRDHDRLRCSDTCVPMALCERLPNGTNHSRLTCNERQWNQNQDLGTSMGTLRSTHECLPMDRVPSVRCTKHYMVSTNADQTRQQCCLHIRRQLHHVQQCRTR